MRVKSIDNNAVTLPSGAAPMVINSVIVLGCHLSIGNANATQNIISDFPSVNKARGLRVLAVLCSFRLEIYGTGQYFTQRAVELQTLPGAAAYHSF
nr:hypothetical protein Iba_chr02bCG0190 [Ipomoea batatas]GMC62053.1 hypothetical protein Iba_chr02cCG0230 [Ipomoea batatas]GMD04743.1 hypothetical protein Iba_scaffold67023CG0010 [Ipomoea batatas]GME06958.1 hypothetical protein Iba_scaffold5767CG0230 [Ipomoea batatas]GME09509.1 hypothetical protein Iba_scaffold8840CG0050 [Ipomoea batatas]